MDNLNLVAAYGRLDDPARAWLHRQDVSRETMLCWPGPIGVAEIEIHELDIFSFAEVGQRAYLHPVYSGGMYTEIIDLVAWLPANPTSSWTLHRTGHPLGDDQLFHAEFWRTPIVVHPSPIAWLAAGGDGVCILDWKMYETKLREITTIVTDDVAFGREVERRLVMPARHCPPIRVRTERAAA